MAEDDDAVSEAKKHAATMKALWELAVYYLAFVSFILLWAFGWESPHEAGLAFGVFCALCVGLHVLFGWRWIVLPPFMVLTFISPLFILYDDGVDQLLEKWVWVIFLLHFTAVAIVAAYTRRYSAWRWELSKAALRCWQWSLAGLVVMGAVAVTPPGLRGLDWFLYNVRIVPHIPACDMYDKRVLYPARLIFGSVTRDYADFVLDFYNHDPDGPNAPLLNKLFPNTLFTVPALYFYRYRGWRHGEGDWGEHAHYSDIVLNRAYFQKREAEGAFDGADLTVFGSHEYSSTPEFHADRCSFMREMILKGGRFATE